MRLVWQRRLGLSIQSCHNNIQNIQFTTKIYETYKKPGKCDPYIGKKSKQEKNLYEGIQILRLIQKVAIRANVVAIINIFKDLKELMI